MSLEQDLEMDVDYARAHSFSETGSLNNHDLGSILIDGTKAFKGMEKYDVKIPD